MLQQGSSAVTGLGPYELLELIGKGGSGEVYRARDRRLGRPVAVKLLAEGLVDRDPKIEARYQREAQLWATLRHPNVVTLLDCSPPGADRLYLVSELVEGGSLREAMTRGERLPAELAATILLPIARALAAAHRLGIIHRDIKPDNILLDRSGDRVTPKLADFGLAVMAVEPRLTTTRALTGSVAYMPPEQLNGRALATTMDIWAFGVTFFELVHGRRPYRGAHLGEVVTRILNERPAREEALFPPELGRVIDRCLARDPGARHRDGAVLARRLGAALRRAGVPDAEHELQRWGADPRHGERMSAAIADGSATAAAKCRDPHERLALVERALALRPEHPGALELLARGDLHPPRPPRRVGLALVAGVLLLAAGAIAAALVLWPEPRSESQRTRTPRDLRHPTGRRGVPVDAQGVGRPDLGAAADAGGGVATGAGGGVDTGAGGGVDTGAGGGVDTGARRPRERRARAGRSRRRRAARKGRLLLTTEPWAEVLVDGRSLGYTPSLGAIVLRAGRRRLLLRNPSCRPRRVGVTIIAGRTIKRHVKLELIREQKTK